VKERKYSEPVKKLVIKPIEGVSTKSTTGLVDNRLFTGKANVYAVRDTQMNIWGLKYSQGILPQPLRQKFTRFEDLKEFATGYFKRRNLQIVEVIDVPAEDRDD
jgi:hypothetical protein